ncbi:glycoside hydrolase superfamily [Piptocephalis cylindrospora]|uniref:beta-N-acetylhexosaminidase n=1 Tax=Piptocephalis cylindrospora TaxID=1907219 RepID=A0A4P9Y6G2_9FUNG|nr:glycoside hydrolase superfamily [Piptocephalis cylindrospora]|eukprot:RKP13430.1 glycoside hydrolase superfamily [Piptocephalis cylindrospora]
MGLPVVTEVRIHVQDPSLSLDMEVDEGYHLDIPNVSGGSGHALIQAQGVYGAIRAMETLSMLGVQGPDAADPVILPHTPYRIIDRPRYPHRGLMLDTSRSYFPVSDLLRTLDAMAWSKLNVFHWHIIDSQSFPLASEVLPQLAQNGAYSPESIYTRKDVERVVAYARLRGIRVIPEFDAPGHTYIWSASFPDLITCPNVQPNWPDVSAEPPSGQLNLIKKESLELMQKLLSEQAQWFPDTYLHIGADEVNTKCYEQDTSIAAYLHRTGMTVVDLIHRWITQYQTIVGNLGKKVVAWEESVLEYGLTPPPKDTLIQVWKGAKNVGSVIEKGLRVLTSPSDYWYLDCGRGEWLAGPGGGTSWCDPFKDWMRIYSYDPLANLTNPSTHPQVMGGEVAMWSEMTDPVNLDTVVWPRASAAAEILWSGKTDLTGKVRSTAQALPRILALRRRMVRRGIRADMVQMEWCERNPGQCALYPWE